MTGDRPIAIVTGSTAPGRIGLATAARLARAGCDLVLTHRGSASPDQLDAARATIASASDRRAAVRIDALDLADLPAAEAWAVALAQSLPRVDVLVHNAAAYDPTPLSTLSAADAERHFRVNALAPALLSRALAPALARSPLPARGSIVALGDIHALTHAGPPRTGYLAYAMSKAALHEAVRVLARELAPRVRVNAVALGVAAFAPHEDPAFQDRYLARVPLARSGTPDDAAEAVRWLALDAAYCTGTILVADGGRSLT